MYSSFKIIDFKFVTISECTFGKYEIFNERTFNITGVLNESTVRKLIKFPVATSSYTARGE